MQRFTDWGEAANHRIVGAGLEEFHDLFVLISSYLSPAIALGFPAEADLAPPNATERGRLRPLAGADTLRQNVQPNSRQRSEREPV